MLITSITEQKKDSGRVSVCIDGKFAFGISKADALYHHLKEGEELSREKYDIITDELVYGKAKDNAVKLLSFAPRTEKELAEKLSADYSPEICSRVTDMLKKYGYIDDEAYTAAYINDSFKYKGRGSLRIKAELRAKGVSEEIISAAFENASPDEEKMAYELLKKRLKGSMPTDRREMAKHYRYLAGRGFSYEVINNAFSRLNADFTEEGYDG